MNKDFIDEFERILGDYPSELIGIVLKEKNISFKAGVYEGRKNLLQEFEYELSKSTNDNEELSAIARVLSKYRADETNNTSKENSK